MPGWKVVISDPETKKSYQTEVDQDKAVAIIGKKISDEISGDLLGLSGYTLKLTGGSDKDGFPMHPTLEGPGRRKTMLTKPPGLHPTKQGERRRKTVRGNTFSYDIAQINTKVVKKGTTPLEEVFGKKEAAQGGEAGTETKAS